MHPDQSLGLPPDSKRKQQRKQQEQRGPPVFQDWATAEFIRRARLLKARFSPCREDPKISEHHVIRSQEVLSYKLTDVSKRSKSSEQNNGFSYLDQAHEPGRVHQACIGVQRREPQSNKERNPEY